MTTIASHDCSASGSANVTQLGVRQCGPASGSTTNYPCTISTVIPDSVQQFVFCVLDIFHQTPPNKLLIHFEAMDPNIERFARIERMAHDVFRPYREIYEEKKKHTIQTKLTMFMKKPTLVTPTAASDDDINDPQPSTSGQ